MEQMMMKFQAQLRRQRASRKVSTEFRLFHYRSWLNIGLNFFRRYLKFSPKVYDQYEYFTLAEADVIMTSPKAIAEVLALQALAPITSMTISVEPMQYKQRGHWWDYVVDPIERRWRQTDYAPGWWSEKTLLGYTRTENATRLQYKEGRHPWSCFQWNMFAPTAQDPELFLPRPGEAQVEQGDRVRRRRGLL